MELRKDEHVTGKDGLIAGAVEMKCNVLCKREKKKSCIIKRKILWLLNGLY